MHLRSELDQGFYVIWDNTPEIETFFPGSKRKSYWKL